jgi:hypothetical protein
MNERFPARAFAHVRTASDLWHSISFPRLFLYKKSDPQDLILPTALSPTLHRDFPLPHAIPTATHLQIPILPFARHISFVSRLPKPSAHLARIASNSHSLPAPRPTGAGSLVRTALPCAVRRASVVPLAALTTIPPVSAEEVADIKDWMAVDRTYEGVYRNIRRGLSYLLDDTLPSPNLGVAVLCLWACHPPRRRMPGGLRSHLVSSSAP